MRCLALDVGTKRIGLWMGEINPQTQTLITHQAELLDVTEGADLFCRIPPIVPCFIEDIAPYGAVAKTVLLTERLTGLIVGRVYEPTVWNKVFFIMRATVKSVVVGSVYAKDADIKNFLVDFYKLSPRAFKRDIWQAVAIAHTGISLYNLPYGERRRRMPNLLEVFWDNFPIYDVDEDDDNEAEK